MTNRQKHFLIGGSILFGLALIGLIIAFAFVKPNIQKQIQKEIKTWDRGLHSDVTLPHSVYSSPNLSNEQEKNVQKAVLENNKLLPKPIFVYKGKLPNKTPNEVYSVVIQPKSDNLCDWNELLGVLGYNERYPTFDSPTSHFEVTICFDKLKRLKTWTMFRGREEWDDIQRIKRGGMLRIIRHELIHSVLGHPRNSTKQHPIYGCKLMCSIPTSDDFGETTKLVLKNILLTPK